MIAASVNASSNRAMFWCACAAAIASLSASSTVLAQTQTISRIGSRAILFLLQNAMVAEFDVVEAR